MVSFYNYTFTIAEDKNFEIKVTNDFKDFAQEGMLKGYQSDVYLKTPIYGINGKVNLDGIKESGFNVYGKCEFGFDRDYKRFDYEHQTGKMVQLHEYDWNLQNYNQGWYPQENPNFKLNENIAILKTENEWKFNIEQGGTLEKDEYSIKLVVYVGNDLDMTYKEYLENEKEKETLDNSKNNDNDYDLELD